MRAYRDQSLQTHRVEEAGDRSVGFEIAEEGKAGRNVVDILVAIEPERNSDIAAVVAVS